MPIITLKNSINIIIVFLILLDGKELFSPVNIFFKFLAKLIYYILQLVERNCTHTIIDTKERNNSVTGVDEEQEKIKESASTIDKKKEKNQKAMQNNYDYIK